MSTFLRSGLVLALLAGSSFAADDVASAVSGSVKSVDKAAKTVVVKVGDGTERTFHFIGKTVSHGATATANGTKDAFSSMKEGDEVVSITRRRARSRRLRKSITSARMV